MLPIICKTCTISSKRNVTNGIVTHSLTTEFQLCQEDYINTWRMSRRIHYNKDSPHIRAMTKHIFLYCFVSIAWTYKWSILFCIVSRTKNSRPNPDICASHFNLQNMRHSIQRNVTNGYISHSLTIEFYMHTYMCLYKIYMQIYQYQTYTRFRYVSKSHTYWKRSKCRTCIYISIYMYICVHPINMHTYIILYMNIYNTI